MSEVLYLAFPDKATALQVARALSGNPEVEEFPADGWLDQDGVVGYYNIDPIGTLYNEDGTAKPGYHLNGWWHGPGEVPAALQAFRIFPETPSRVFG